MKIVRSNQQGIRDWNDVQFVLAVGQTGSFYAAAEYLGTHHTTVSRRVQHLEKDLRTKLFVRRAHGMVLTPAGRALVAKASDMEEAVTMIRSDIAGLDTRLTGVVRLHVTEGIGIYWLTPVLMEFSAHYPDISLEVFTGVAPPDLLAGDADISISLLRPSDPRLVVLLVGHPAYALFASRNYLKLNGSPQDVDELKRHKLVNLSLYRTNPQLKWWNDLADTGGRTIFFSNSVGLFLAAVQEGFGIAMIASIHRYVAPDLTKLSIEPECHSDLWMVTHEATNRSAKVRAVMRFLKSQFGRDRQRWFT